MTLSLIVVPAFPERGNGQQHTTLSWFTKKRKCLAVKTTTRSTRAACVRCLYSRRFSNAVYRPFGRQRVVARRRRRAFPPSGRNCSKPIAQNPLRPPL